MAITQFSPADIAIDLGTSSSRVYVRGKGIIVNEPSVVAMKAGNSRRGIAVGEDAEQIAGRSAESVRLVYPIKEGRITDLETAQLMADYFVNKALGSVRMKPRIIGLVPLGLTRLEGSMFTNVLNNIGARKQTTIEQVVAGGLGSGLSIYEPQGSFVVDIGAGKTEIALLSMGGIVVSHSKPVAGMEIDNAIAGYIQREYDMIITPRTAEQIKFDLIDIRPGENKDRKVIVRGRDIATGMPTTSDVSLEGVAGSILKVVNEIIEAIQWALGKTPPELCQDVLRNGIVLCGGTSQLPKLDRMISETVGIPVRVAPEAGDSVVLGAGYMADHFDVFSGTASEKE